MADAETIETWNGESAQAWRSPSGVLLLADCADNVIRPPHGAWPPPALVMKLGDAERPDRPLPAALAEPLSATLGIAQPCSRSTARTRSPGARSGR